MFKGRERNAFALRIFLGCSSILSHPPIDGFKISGSTVHLYTISITCPAILCFTSLDGLSTEEDYLKSMHPGVGVLLVILLIATNSVLLQPSVH